MLRSFVELDTAAEIMGHDWSVEKVIEKIKEGELTAYARIHCSPHDNSTLDDSDDEYDEKYEIARITNLKLKPSSDSSAHTSWFYINYEPIGDAVTKNEMEPEYHDANHCDQRVFGYLESKSKRREMVSTEQICLLNSDVLLFLSGKKLNQKIESHPVQEQVKIRTAKYERPSQLDRKDKTGPLATLLDNALQAFYKRHSKASAEFLCFMTFVKNTFINEHPEYMKDISKIGETDEKYLLLKSKNKKKWYTMEYVKRIYKKRRELASYHTVEVSPSHSHPQNHNL